MAAPNLKAQYRKSILDEQLRSYDPRAHAVTTIEELHRLTHDGMVFFVQRSELDVPDQQFRRILLRTGSIPPHFKGIGIAASEGPVVVELYENAVVDVLGASIVPINTNRLSPRVPLTTVFDSTTTFTSNGDPLLGGLYIPQNGNQGVSAEPTGLIEEFILKPNTDYQLSLQNDPAGSGSADIVAQFSWYELDYPEDATDIDNGAP